jgi:hypothetical protein
MDDKVIDLEPWLREGALFDEREGFPATTLAGPFIFLEDPVLPTLPLAGLGLEDCCFRVLELVFLDAPLLELDKA